MRIVSLAVLLSTLLMTNSAEAYIGPGAAAGTITAVLGIIASMFMAFVAVLWYPVKRLFKRARSVGNRPAAGRAQPKPAKPADG